MKNIVYSIRRESAQAFERFRGQIQRMVAQGTMDKYSGGKFYDRGRSIVRFFLIRFILEPTPVVANSPMGRLGFHRPGECPWPKSVSTKKGVRTCSDPTVNRLPVHDYQTLRPKKKLYRAPSQDELDLSKK
jgi:hypothetical protein